MTYAIVPAAGMSTRMGQPKLALPFGDCTVLEHVIAALRGGGVECVLVVLAPHVRDLAPRARAAGAEVCELLEATGDMRATIEQGLDWLQQSRHPQPKDRWLLAPADHPTLSPQVVRHLLAVSQTVHSIVVPVVDGKRGHPTVFAWRHVSNLRGHPAIEGFNTYLRLQSSDVVEVPVASTEVLFDLDTPEDYARLLAASSECEPSMGNQLRSAADR